MSEKLSENIEFELVSFKQACKEIKDYDEAIAFIHGVFDKTTTLPIERGIRSLNLILDKVEVLERDHEIAERLREAKENIEFRIKYDLDERDKSEVFLRFINSILGVSEETQSSSALERKVENNERI